MREAMFGVVAADDGWCWCVVVACWAESEGKESVCCVSLSQQHARTLMMTGPERPISLHPFGGPHVISDRDCLCVAWSQSNSKCCCFFFSFFVVEAPWPVNWRSTLWLSFVHHIPIYPPSHFNHVDSIQAAKEQAGQGRGHRCQEHRGYTHLQKQAACPVALLARNHFSVSELLLPLAHGDISFRRLWRTPAYTDTYTYIHIHTHTRKANTGTLEETFPRPFLNSLQEWDVTDTFTEQGAHKRKRGLPTLGSERSTG